MDTPTSDDERAHTLVDRYSDLILRLSYTYLKSTYDAEDICQTVLIKALLRTAPFENDEHEKAWVIRTTLNACKDLLRSGWRKRHVEVDAQAYEQIQLASEGALNHTSAHDAVGFDAHNPVLDAVMTLPANYRESIFLYYYEGYSAREIAQITGRSESAVNAHLSRGRKKLKTLLQGDNYAF